jgi:signal transduction histidine kinase/ActR/RegA family two-component response regulator
MQPSGHLGTNTATSEEERTLRAEQVRQFYGNAHVGLLASVINSLVLAAIQRDVASHAALVAWVASLTAISFLRYCDVRAYRRRSPQASEATYWGKRFIIGLAASGVAWGFSAVLLFPVNSLAHQTFLAFVIGGMVAGAAGAFSSDMKAFLAFGIPALSPIIVRFTLRWDEFHLTMGGMVFLFGVMMFFIAKEINSARITSVRLRYENSDLESHAEERTEDLRKAYEALKEETTQRKCAESRLNQTQKMEALGTLAGGIAHDFNNILAAIIGFSEMAIDRTPEGLPARRSMDRVFAAGLRGRDLVKQILAFSRRAEQEKEPIRVDRVVNETLKLLGPSLPAGVDIRTDLKGGVGYVLADRTHMEQIVMNLCTNAAHAMCEKGGTIDIGLTDLVVPDSGGPDDIKPGPYVKLTVRDTGIGISSQILDRIFDPFFTTKKSGEGTGLGLSVVHGIVKDTKGYITVESEPGKGSTFTIYFPKIEGGPEMEGAKDELIPTGTERVLFVDDEETLVEIGEQILAELGYDVTSLTSSREALALLKDDPFRFDLVMMDQTMPEITGIELAREILPLRPDMPIIMCTGFSHLIDADKARTAGIKAFVMKPLTKKEIARTIRRALDK